MTSLDEFWRAMFGESISPFEEMLMVRGAWVMTPEEPLYAVFAMLVRVVHEGQGNGEKALLRFAPELISLAQAIIAASVGIERQLSLIQRRADELSAVLDSLARKSSRTPFPHERHRGEMPEWLMSNLGPVATTLLTLFFCFGFVLASYVHS